MIVLSTVGGGSAKLPRCYNRLPSSAFGSSVVLLGRRGLEHVLQSSRLQGFDETCEGRRHVREVGNAAANDEILTVRMPAHGLWVLE